MFETKGKPAGQPVRGRIKVGMPGWAKDKGYG